MSLRGAFYFCQALVAARLCRCFEGTDAVPTRRVPRARLRVGLELPKANERSIFWPVRDPNFLTEESRMKKILTGSLCVALIGAALASMVYGQEKKDSPRSEEHTSELQSRQYLVCRLLLEKKNSSDWTRVNAPSASS